MKKLSSINKRRLNNFISNKRGFYSFWIFFILFMITLFSDFIANEKPLLLKYENKFYYPIFQSYPETTFGGDFETEADYRDPFVKNLGLDENGMPRARTNENGQLVYDSGDFAEHDKEILDFTLNKYQKTTNMKVANGEEEQALSGLDYNLSSQVPYMPWTIFNFQGYRFENEKAAQDTKGKVYSLEMALNPSLQFDISRDVSSVNGVDDVDVAKLTFVYPPRENKPTLQDGLVSEVAFVKENMEDKLKEKVRRNNNIIIEVQGSVIVTSQ